MIRKRVQVICELDGDEIGFEFAMPSTLTIMQALEALDTDSKSAQLRAMLDLVVGAVVAVRGLTVDGDLVAWPSDKGEQGEILSMLPAQMITALASAIMEARGLTGDRLGKLRITVG